MVLGTATTFCNTCKGIMGNKKISHVLRYTFLLSGLAALLFGLTFLLFIEPYLSLIKWPYSDPVLSRIFGAALLGFWLLQWLSFRETEWVKVKNIVIMMIFWHLVGGLACLFSHFKFDLPIANWLHIIVLFIFLFAYLYSYYVERR